MSELWSPLLEELAESFGGYRLDWPGFGESFRISGSAPTLHELVELTEAFVQSLGPGPVILVGHDLGAAVAQICAIRLGRHVLSSIILINPASVSEALTILPGSRLGFRLRRFLRAELKSASRLGAEQARRLEDEAAPAAVSALQASWPSRDERRRYLGRLAQIQQPVLILWGEHDRINPIERGDSLFRQLPEAYAFSHPQAGHWLPLEEPGWMAVKIREFLFRQSLRVAA